MLDILAGGRKPLNEIAKAVGVDSRSITYQLQTLAALGYVERILPLTAEKHRTRCTLRTGRCFPALRYRFVFPNQSLIRSNPAGAFKDLIAGELEAYFGQCFERLCREALTRIYLKEGVGPLTRSERTGTSRSKSMSWVCAMTTGLIWASASGAVSRPCRSLSRSWKPE